MLGNNSNIIRRAFENRLDYWREVPCFDSSFHFRWHPFSKGIRFEQLSLSQKQMVNHFEFHDEITTKDKLYKNLLEYSHKNKVDVLDFVPLTFILNFDSEIGKSEYDKFINCYNILKAMTDEFKETENDTNKIFIKINSKLQSISLSDNKRSSNSSKAKLYPTHFIGENIWILKPTGLNRGRGVSVFNSLESLSTLIKEYSEGVPGDEGPIPNTTHDPQPVQTTSECGISNLYNLPCLIKTKSFVVQKYIERTLLIHNRKFDIRCWALLTEDMKLYFFKEGYIRTSCSEYSMDKDSIERKDVHLTNNAVQKYCADYGKFEDGNQLSFPMFQVI